jgi:hypothetical protein
MDYPLAEPSIYNMIRECPHCGERKQLNFMSLRLWGGLDEPDNRAQYFLFHENIESLVSFWAGHPLNIR